MEPAGLGSCGQAVGRVARTGGGEGCKCILQPQLREATTGHAGSLAPLSWQWSPGTQCCHTVSHPSASTSRVLAIHWWHGEGTGGHLRQGCSSLWKAAPPLLRPARGRNGDWAQLQGRADITVPSTHLILTIWVLRPKDGHRAWPPPSAARPSRGASCSQCPRCPLRPGPICAPGRN